MMADKPADGMIGTSAGGAVAEPESSCCDDGALACAGCKGNRLRNTDAVIGWVTAVAGRSIEDTGILFIFWNIKATVS